MMLNLQKLYNIIDTDLIKDLDHNNVIMSLGLSY